MTELLKISDMRNIHKDIPNKVDGAIKYTDGARLGVHSCKIEITDGLLTIDQGELQYGTKRYSVPSYSSAIPYCYSDTLGNVVYSTFDYIPVVWDNPNRLFPTVDPESIPEGYYANLWLYAVLGCDPEDEDEASLMCVLGNTLYLTEREAQSEYLPLTEVTPFGGTVATYNLVGNLVCIGRITTGVLAIGDGPICTYSFSQPMAFSFNVPPVPNIRDIPDSYKYVEGYTYTVTEIDRNRDLAVFHTDSEEGELSTTIILPEASAFGAGYWLRILSLSTYVGPEGGAYAYLHVGLVNEGASPKIIWHGSTVGTESIATMQYFASVRLVSNGMDWVATDLSGTWTGDTTYCCDGNIKDGVQDNVVTIDAYGNIQDSGLAASSLAGFVVGPASATDTAIALFDTGAGNLIKNSLATVDEDGSLSIPAGQTYALGSSDLTFDGDIATSVVLPVPTGFAWTTPGFDVFQTPSGYRTSFPWANYRPTTATKVRYVDIATGSNSDSGATWGDAWKSISYALTQAAADPDITLVYVKAGHYAFGDAWDYTNVDHDIAFVADGGTVVTSNGILANTLSWAPDGTYPNVYVGTRSSASFVVDHAQLTTDGNGTRLTVQTSVADVDANPGSYFVSGSSVYVRTLDSRSPDVDIEIIMGVNGARMVGVNNYYVEGFDFRGGNSALYCTNAVRGVFVDCTFRYSLTSNGLDTDGCTNIYVKGCEASENYADGFNYHTTSYVMEEDCVGYGNGNGAGSNNGSSQHENNVIIRVDCTYRRNNGPQIADIVTADSWNVGCTTSHPSGVTGWQSTGFYSEGNQWLHGCLAHDCEYDIYEAGAETTYTYATTYTTHFGTLVAYVGRGTGTAVVPNGENRIVNRLPGSTTGNLVSIDANDDIQDSGFTLDDYRYKAEQFLPVVATPYAVSTTTDKGKWVLWGGVGTLNITLPAASAMGSGGWIGAWNFGSVSPRVNLNRAGADTLTIGTSTGAASIYSTVRGSYARLVSNGVNGWLLMDASGTWTDGTVTRHFDANIPLNTPGNAVTTDGAGDIVDSGYPIITSADVSALIEASGGGGGSDMTIYSNIAGDFSAVQTGADTIGIFGLTFNVNSVQIKRIVSQSTGGVAAVIAARGANLVCTWTPDLAIAGKGTIMTSSLGTLAATDEYIVEIEGPPKGYNAATDSNKSYVVNDLRAVNDGLVASGTVEFADVIEIVKPLMAEGYNAISLVAELGAYGDTVKVYGSNSFDGTSAFYDITAIALGVNVVSASGAYQTPDVMMFEYVKIVASAAVASVDVYLTRFLKK